ncbi:MAG: hypothetical protein KGM99_07385 [Burkholderiales bacterium]|nr:hypothetical protein [Burkholderiales bacterium]
MRKCQLCNELPGALRKHRRDAQTESVLVSLLAVLTATGSQTAFGLRSSRVQLLGRCPRGIGTDKVRSKPSTGLLTADS